MAKVKVLVGISVLILLIVLFKPTTDQSEDSWRSDGIDLRQHETEGWYGCFGCSTATDGPALCIDPIFEMKQVEETPERYCNSNFEVVT